MRTPDEVRLVEQLAAAGVSNSEIARRTGIPRATVRTWRRGDVPVFSRGRAWANGRPVFTVEEERAYAYPLGLYLGDGHVTQMPRTWRLRITLDSVYPGVVAGCVAAAEAALGNRAGTVSTPSRAVVVQVYSNPIAQLFPQHGPGMKHEREISLTAWQRRITRRHPEAFVRGLIHSDGTRCLNTVKVRGKSYAYPRYQFCNYSADIRGLFCEHLDALSIPWRQMNRVTISVARRDGVARLDEFVGPKR